MAKNKSIAVAAIPALVLTKPNKGTAGTKKKDKLHVEGLEETAAKVRERAEKIESLEAEQKVDKAKIVEVCKKERRDAEVSGDFHTTCLVESDDGKPVQVVFTNKFSKVDVTHESALKQALNGQFDTLFRKGVDVAMKDGITFEKLQKVLGDKFDAFAALCDLTEYLSPDRDFMQKRAALRPALDAATNSQIDAISDQTQYTPMVKTK